MGQIQHFIPSCILKNFGYRENLKKQNEYFVLNKQQHSIERIKSTSSKKFEHIVWKYNFYELMTNKGTILCGTENKLENYLGVIETKFGKVLLKIKTHAELVDSDIVVILDYTLCQILRTPRGQKDISDAMIISLETNDATLQSNLSKCIASRYSDIAEVERLNEDLKLDFLEKHVYILTIAPMININTSSFILGLNLPVVGNIDFENFERTFYFPVSPSECIVLSNKTYDNRYIYVNSVENINFINNIIIQNNDIVLGRNKNILSNFLR